MKYPITCQGLCIILLSVLAHPILAQTLKQEKMAQLSYLVGEWVGTTKVYQDGVVVKEGAAFEKIAYDMDGSILLIELNTEFLQLRTIILYHEEDQEYKYHRFSKDGAAVYPAEFKDGHLIVWRDEKTRFFFTQDTKGDFWEYGEKLVDGEWVKFFEDTFVNTQ